MIWLDGMVWVDGDGLDGIETRMTGRLNSVILEFHDGWRLGTWMLAILRRLETTTIRITHYTILDETNPLRLFDMRLFRSNITWLSLHR